MLDGGDHSNVLEEIGRLRERTFRFVGEGTGHCKDIDDFDRYYRHLILWDETDLEIVGLTDLVKSGNGRNKIAICSTVRRCLITQKTRPPFYGWA